MVSSVEDETPTTKSINVHGMPEDLWRRFKVQAIAEGITLQEALRQAIKQYIGRAA